MARQIPPLALDWTKAILNPSGDTPMTVDTGAGTIAFNSDLFDVQGSLGFDILGFVLAQGQLHMSRADVSVTDPAVNGGAATSGTLLTISVSGGDAFIGTGASFSGSTLLHPSSAVGFYLGSAGFDLELLTATTGESFVGLQASIGAADLQGIPDFELHLRSASVEVSRSSTTARLDWAHALTATDSSVTLPTFTMGSDVIDHLSGAAALSVAGVVAATTTDFTFDHTVATGSDGHGIAFTGADVWALSLTGPSVFVGTGAALATDGTSLGYNVAPASNAIGISASATSFKLAEIVTASTKYFGLEVDGLNGDIVGIAGADVHAKGVDALANTVSPSGTRLDWTGVGSVLPFTFTGLTSSVSLHLSGALALSLAGVVNATTSSFTLDHVSVSGSDGAATGPITLSGADLWSFSLGGASVFVGTGGSLVADGSASGYHVDHASDAIGISASATSFAFAQATQGATQYEALEVTGLDGDLVGITGVTIHVKGVTALANTVTPGTATKLNWDGLGSAIPVAFTGLTRSVSLRLSGAVALQLANVVAATADGFTLDHTTVATGTDGNGVDLAGGDAWSFSLTGPAVFAGTGGGLSVDSGATSGYDVSGGSFGLSASASGLKLAQIALGGTTYTGIEVDGLSGLLIGIPGVTVRLAGASALANEVSTGTTKLSWGTLDAGVLPFTFD